MNLFECESGNNETGWCNPAYDNLVEKAAEEKDPSKRIFLYREAQKILTEIDVPIAPIFISVQQCLIKPYVKGLEPDPLGLILLSRVYLTNNQ